MVLLLMRKANGGNTPTHNMIPKKRYCASYFPENKVDWYISLLFYINYNQSPKYCFSIFALQNYKKRMRRQNFSTNILLRIL